MARLKPREDPQASPEKILQTVRAEIDAFVGEADQFDDITMMCFNYNGDREEPKDDK